MGKQTNVVISTPECDLEFAIQSSTTGKNLFDQICHTIGVKEVWYFGLEYTDKNGFSSWIKMYKKVKDQNLQKMYPWRFKFRVKLYPEDVSLNVIQDTTLRLFYMEVKEQVLADGVYCPPETSILLASYVCQEKYGDFDPEIYHSLMIDIDYLLPARVITQHRLRRSQWEEKIIDCWLEHKDQLREESMLSYLKIAQDLDMYGINYFEIYNRKGSKLWLGIDALGINIYHHNDKLAPHIGFPWSEINNISYSDKRFTITTVNSKTADFIFTVEKARTNKCILDLCIRNHELYIRRRKPDTAEVQQMRMQSLSDRREKRQERNRLKREREARIVAEHHQRVLEQKLMAIEQEQQVAKKALMVYQAKSSELERKIQERESQSQKMEEQRASAEAEMNKLESELSLQLEEKLELREQYVTKEEVAQKSARELSDLQGQAEQLRLEYDDLHKKYTDEVMSRSLTNSLVSEGSDHLEDTCSDSQDFITEIDGNRSEETRDVELTRDHLLQRKMRDLEKELLMEKNYSCLTNEDHQYMALVQSGDDKYKTLRKIRKGNTRQRVDEFETMATFKNVEGESIAVSGEATS